MFVVQPWAEYADSVTSVQIGDGITTIGAYAFYSMTALQEVYMADSVVTISKNAFRYTSVENVRFSENLGSIGSYAFSGNNISILTLPDNTSIGTYAFQNCTNLECVSLPQNLKEIQDYAFYGCTALTDISFPETLTTIGKYSFRDCTALTNVTFPDSLTALDKGSFYGCTSLETITFGAGLTEIAWDCFHGCTSLTQIVIDGNITTIANTAFQDCTGLTYVYMGANVTSLGEYVFSGCCALESVVILNPTLTMPLTQQFGDSDFTDFTIYGISDSTAQTYAEKYGIAFEVYGDIAQNEYPFGDGLYWSLVNGVLTIYGEGAMPDYALNGTDGSTPPWFLYSDQIQSVVIENGITRIGDNSFKQIETIASVSLPESLTSIGKCAFYETSITEISVPEGVMEIGTSAFQNTSLVSLILPEGLTEIPDYMCAYCDELTQATLPSTLISIGDCAFEYCTNLGNLAFPNGLETVGDFAFYCCTNVTASTFSDHLVSIGGAAFAQCSSLSEMRLGSNLESIGVQAFEKTGLTGDITIPPTTTTLGGYVFTDCPGITSFTILNPDLLLLLGHFGYVTGEDSYEPIATTFYGFTGSTTETYASMEDVFTFASLDDMIYEKGDANLDGSINLADVVLLQRYLLNEKAIKSQQFSPCDVNDDGNVNGFDLALLRQMLQDV